MGDTWEVKLKAGRYMRPVTITREGSRLFLRFGYNAHLVEEVRAMQGARWHGYDEVSPRKVWSVADSDRNRFQLAYLAHPGADDPLNPYRRYDQPLVEYESRRPLYGHQLLMCRAALTYRQVIWAAEMGCVASDVVVPGVDPNRTMRQLYESWVGGHPVSVRSLCDGSIRLNQVSAVVWKGMRVAVRLTTRLGRQVTLTPDHEVCVGDRYVAAGELRAGDPVAIDSRHFALDEVERVEDAGAQSVYDVVCGDPHRNFVAGGVVVHNCGKTLSAIEVMERGGAEDWLWVGPRSALYSVQLEFEKWRAGVRPKFYTYEALKRLVEGWPSGKPAPQGLVVDECSRCKNSTAQRTQSVMHLADSMRREHGDRAYVVEMSGSPAPKSPADWWALCEIAQPGFLREGNVDKFRRRLAIIEQGESLAGGHFPKLVTWRDDPRKCDVCGQLAESERHDARYMATEGGDYHPFRASVDEVSYLYRRMRGLVTVVFKRDVLSELPEKIYRVVECKPTQATLNAARAITARAPSTIQALTLLRELSDGFQYTEEDSGFEACDRCGGSGQVDERYDASAPDDYPDPEEFERGHRVTDDGDRGPDIVVGVRRIACYACSGSGSVPRRTRTSTQVPCPKEDALIDVLDEHEEVGRLIVFAGFTGSIDRVVQVVTRAKWVPIRVDGRGWWSPLPGKPVDLLRVFQEGQATHPRVAFVSQPGAGGMGLNLTASPTVLYYSNDFNAESRIQSENRAHRPGMDLNRGCTIIDLIHLQTDLLVLENLKAKKRLQDMSLGAFKNALEHTTEQRRSV